MDQEKIDQLERRANKLLRRRATIMGMLDEDRMKVMLLKQKLLTEKESGKPPLPNPIPRTY